MSFFKIKTDIASNKESTGGDYLSKSGIYPITIKFVSVDVGESGDRSLNFNIDYKGNPTTLYGLRLDNKDGSENFQAAVFNRLCNVLQLDSITAPEVQEHQVGKDNTPTEFSVLPDFSDQDVAIRVQEEYGKYNGQIRKRLAIKNFYRLSDGASASEIISGSNFGEQFKKDQAYASNITYKDCTEDEVKAWQASQAGAKPTPAATVAKPAANIFG
mgnify:FL=1